MIFYFLVRAGKCPKVPPECLSTEDIFAPPPIKCGHDGFCLTGQKCCFNRCHGHSICMEVDKDIY